MRTRAIRADWASPDVAWRVAKHIRLRVFTVGIVALTCLLTPVTAQESATKPTVNFVTSTKFKEALSQPLSLSWTDRPVRAGLLELSELRRLAILLDRRIDPTSSISLQAQKLPLKQLVEQAAAPLTANVSVIGNVVYVGPQVTAQKLRTIVDLRHAELISPLTGSKNAVASSAATSARTSRRTIQWDDLTTPAEILNLIAQRYELRMEGLDSVPHDLWVANSLPTVTSAEALQLVLGQFDLTFEWLERGKSVRIVPLPDSPRIEVTYEVGSKASQLAKSLPTDFPQAAITVSATKLVVLARSEEHDRIDALLHPDRVVARKTNALPPQVVFNFEVKNAPLIEFMRTLEKQSDFRFEYDPDELEQAGIKLTREVSLKMLKAKPVDLFNAMFADSGIAFEVDGTTVTLSPK